MQFWKMKKIGLELCMLLTDEERYPYPDDYCK